MTVIRVLCLCLLLVAGAAVAREAVVGMSERVFKVVGEVQELIDAGNYDDARAQLEQLLERRLSSYETAHALNLKAYTWYQQDRLDKAREVYEEALAQPGLPDSMRTNLLLTLGQVCLVQEAYADAESYLLRLLQQPDQATGANKVLLANALMGQERYETALIPLMQAIDESAEEGQRPRENWLSMLASVYYELERFEDMRDVVAALVETYPREQYLMNLAALHGQLGDTGRQLALVESLADDERLQQEAHLKLLANLLLAEGRPRKAAALVQREMDTGRIDTTLANLELLSQAWYTAAEPVRALTPLRRAAEMSGDGELYLRLARLHMDAYDWVGADRAARAALAKGGLREEGHAWLLRGMARVRLEQFTDARRFLQRAGGFDETERYAQQWRAWLDSESKRTAALEGQS